MNRIVIELDPGANMQIRILFSHSINFAKIDPGVITIVVCERNVAQVYCASRIRPWLKQRRRITLHPVPLGMRMIIREELVVYR